MPTYLISGPSGSGKTTVGTYLAKQGYTVIETDHEPGLSGYVHKQTGEKAPERLPYPLPQEWLDTYSWDWDKARMKELFDKHKDDIVFFCGGAHNEKNYFDWFDLRFALSVDNDTLKKRLQKREPHRWLDNSPELNNMLTWNTRFCEYSQQVGAILINSSQPIAQIATNILTEIHEAKHNT